MKLLSGGSDEVLSILLPSFSLLYIDRLYMYNRYLYTHTNHDVYIRHGTRTSLVFHWLRFHAPNAGGPGSIPGQRTSSYMP